MCAHADKPYEPKFLCLNCRGSVHHPVPGFAQSSDWAYRGPLCPTCRTSMQEVGADFHAPARRDDAGWALVAELLASGVHFASCGCHGPGWRSPVKAQMRKLRVRAALRARPVTEQLAAEHRSPALPA